MTLSKDESSTFFKMMISLHIYTNFEFGIIKGITGFDSYMRTSTEKTAKIRNKLFENIGIIDSFIEDSNDSFNEEEREILITWKKFIRGEFIIERYLKNHAIFYMDNKFYAVKALVDPFTELILPESLPLFSNAILLPFKGQIIYDGFLSNSSISIVGNMKNDLRNAYLAAKENGTIITDLLAPEPKPKGPDINKLKQKFSKLHKRLDQILLTVEKSAITPMESKLITDFLSTSMDSIEEIISGDVDFALMNRKIDKLINILHQLGDYADNR